MDELNPIKCLRIIAMFRLINPSKEIRIAGGREVNLRSLQPLAYKLLIQFCWRLFNYWGQPNQLDYDMLEDLGFEIDIVNNDNS